MNEAPKRRWFQFPLATLFWMLLAVGLAVFAFQERRERKRVVDEARAAATYVSDMTVDEAIQWQIKTGRTEIPLCEQREGGHWFQYTLRRREISEQEANTPHELRP